MEGKELSIPTEIFLQDNAEEFMCVICTNLAFPTVQTTCGHLFCDHCLMQSLRIKNECPTCRTPNPNPQENLFITRFMNNLKVKCLNFNSGCKYEGTFMDMLNEHVYKNCEFVPKPCPFANEGCTIKLTKKEMDEHVTICQYRRIKCKLCSKEYNFKEEKEHLDSCPEMVIKCPYDCQVEMKRSEMKNHMEFCPEKITNCVVIGCHQKIKTKDLNSHLINNLFEHLMLMNNQYLQIKNENEQMKKHIEKLNEKISFLEKEMNNSKNDRGNDDEFLGLREMRRSLLELGESSENFKTNLNPHEQNIEFQPNTIIWDPKFRHFMISNNGFTIKKSSGYNAWNDSQVFIKSPISPHGQYYLEFKIESINEDKTGMVIGITKNKSTSFYKTDIAIGMGGYKYGVLGNDTIIGNNGDRIGILLDFESKIIRFFFNGMPTDNFAIIKSNTIYYPVVHIYYIEDSVSVSFPKLRDIQFERLLKMNQFNNEIWESSINGNLIPFNEMERRLEPKDKNFQITNCTIRKTGIINNWVNAQVFLGKAINTSNFGKIFWEITIDSINNDKTGLAIGITKDRNASYVDKDIVIGMGGDLYNVIGKKVLGHRGDTFGIMIDQMEKIIKFYKNGIDLNIIGSLQSGCTYYPVIHLYYIGDQVTVKFPNHLQANDAISKLGGIPFNDHERVLQPLAPVFSLSNNNLTIKKISGGNQWKDAPVFIGKRLNFQKGKVYWEVFINSINGDTTGMVIGITADKNSSFYQRDIAIGMKGYKYGGVTGNNNFIAKNGDRIGVLVDFDDSVIRFYRNGEYTHLYGKIMKGIDYYPVIHIYYINDQVTVKFPNLVNAIQSIRGPFHLSTEFEKQFDPKYRGLFQISQKSIKKIGGNNSWKDAQVFLSKKLNYNSGRVYWEIIIDSINHDRTGMVIGITPNKGKSHFRNDIGIGMSGYDFPFLEINVFSIKYGGVIGNENFFAKKGDRIGVLVDFDNSIIRFYKNGASTSFIGLISKNKEYWPVIHLYYINDKVTVNFS